MGFAIFVDKVDAVPVTIHKDSCSYYVNRKQDAPTTVWCQTDTMDDAEALAHRLVKSRGSKRAGCCLDGTTL
jgi:hypothetical protein